jgi:hypothetical protein
MSKKDKFFDYFVERIGTIADSYDPTGLINKAFSKIVVDARNDEYKNKWKGLLIGLGSNFKDDDEEAVQKWLNEASKDEKFLKFISSTISDLSDCKSHHIAPLVHGIILSQILGENRNKLSEIEKGIFHIVNNHDDNELVDVHTFFHGIVSFNREDDGFAGKKDDLVFGEYKIRNSHSSFGGAIDPNVKDLFNFVINDIDISAESLEVSKLGRSEEIFKTSRLVSISTRINMPVDVDKGKFDSHARAGTPLDSTAMPTFIKEIKGSFSTLEKTVEILSPAIAHYKSRESIVF